jgi:ribonuclease HI
MTDWIQFSREAQTVKSLSDAVRIFTEGATCNDRPKIEKSTEERDLVIIGTDGSCMNNGQVDARAGAGGYSEAESELNFAIRVPKDQVQTNQTGELLALAHLGVAVNKSADMYIETDSTYALSAATTLLQKHEDQGMIGIANKELIRYMLANLRQRTGATYIKWVPGHAGLVRNEGADQMAAKGARLEADETLPAPRQDLRMTGAKLAVVTQKLAYRAIREIKMKSYQKRARSSAFIAKAQDEVQLQWNIAATEKAIWKAIRHKDFDKATHTFLWKTAHEAYMVGDKWLRPSYSEELQERAYCNTCHAADSMEHILTECNEPGQEKIWDLTKNLWEKRGYEWKKPKLGLIVACALIEVPAPNRLEQAKAEKEGLEPKKGAERLYRILITEAARAIWAMRCKRVIEPPEHPEDEESAERRWRARLNSRIDLDIALTNKRRYKKKALSKTLVKSTWHQLIQDGDRYEWIKEGGVLVGSTPRPIDDRLQQERETDEWEWDEEEREKDEEEHRRADEERRREEVRRRWEDVAVDDDHG